MVRCDKDFIAYENPLPRVRLTPTSPLPKISLSFEITGSNEGTDHRLIPKYQVGPLAHAGIPTGGNFSVVFKFNKLTDVVMILCV